jgi:transposase, IS6 family
VISVRWYLRYGLSYRDVEELLAERGVTVDHVTIYRWVQRFTPEFIEAARPCRHVPGNRWFADETYLKIAGKWAYLYRAVTSMARSSTSCCPRGATWQPRGASSAMRCAPTRPRPRSRPTAPCLPAHPRRAGPRGLAHCRAVREQPDRSRHGRLKARLRPMRGLNRHSSARILAAGHAFVQNLRRGHYDIAADVPHRHRLRIVFDDLALTI